MAVCIRERAMVAFAAAVTAIIEAAYGTGHECTRQLPPDFDPRAMQPEAAPMFYQDEDPDSRLQVVNGLVLETVTVHLIGFLKASGDNAGYGRMRTLVNEMEAVLHAAIPVMNINATVGARVEIANSLDVPVRIYDGPDDALIDYPVEVTYPVGA